MGHQTPRIVFITPELAPFSGESDLGELSEGLAQALHSRGLQVTVITPLHGSIASQRFGLARRLTKLPVHIGSEVAEVEVLNGRLTPSGVDVCFLDHPPSFDRESVYGPYPDDHRRFFLFAQAALQWIRDQELRPDVIHAHDWPCGFLPLLLRRHAASANSDPGPRIVFSAHDTTHLGCLPPGILDDLGLGYDTFHPEGIEYYGQVSMLKAGVTSADAITTFSTSAARQMQQERHGSGLHGLYSARGTDLVGIPCGIDNAAWSPQTDRNLAAPYGPESLADKTRCKRALQHEIGLRQTGTPPLLAMLGPLTPNSGVELLLDAAVDLLSQELQLVLVGDSDDPIRERIASVAAQAADRVTYRRSLSPPLLRRLLAGADGLLLPTCTGPGNLNAIKAMCYGTIPVVHPVGSLADTVVEFDRASASGTGFVFAQHDTDALLGAIQRLRVAYGNETHWTKIRQNAMAQRFSWEAPAARYEQLYRRLIERPAS